MKNIVKKYSLITALITSILALGGYYYLSHTERSGIYEYRPEKDLPFVEDLFKKNWYWLVAEGSTFDPRYSFTHMTPTSAPQDKGKVIAKVYWVENQPVGFVAYYMRTFYEGFIWFLVVKEEFRRRGISSKLFDAAVEDLRKRGASTIWLVTRTSNVSAQGLYKKAGFKEVWRDADFVKFENNLK